MIFSQIDLLSLDLDLKADAGRRAVGPQSIEGWPHSSARSVVHNTAEGGRRVPREKKGGVLSRGSSVGTEYQSSPFGGTLTFSRCENTRMVSDSFSSS